MAVKKSLVVRCLEGKEREAVVRGRIPENRVTLFWDILKGRIGQLALVNLVIVLSFLPVIAIMLWRLLAAVHTGQIGPYGSGLTIGYPVIFDPAYAERMRFLSDMLFFSLFIPASAIAAVGLSGGVYLCRNLVLTEGVFFWRDFVRGIRKCYVSALTAVLFFTLLLFIAVTVGNLAAWYAAVGDPNTGWLIAAEVVMYILIALAIPLALWMLVLGAGYKLDVFGLFKSAVVMMFHAFPQTLIFGIAAVAPVFLVIFGSGLLLWIGGAYYIILGFTVGILAYVSFAQWIFDLYFVPVVKEEKAAGKESKSVPVDPEAALAEARRKSVLYGKSELLSRPVLPLEEGTDVYVLPEKFTREDLVRLAESRAAVRAEVSRYEKAHEKEERYLEYNRRFEDREKMITDGKEKKKKVRPPKMLNNR